MADMISLAPALQQALKRSESARLAAAEYARLLEEYRSIIVANFEDAVRALHDQQVQEAVAQGLGAVAVDDKAAELAVLRKVETAIKDATALIVDAASKVELDQTTGKALITEERQIADSRALVGWVLEQFGYFPKARMAKIARELIDKLGEIPGERSKALQVEVCEQVVGWCKDESRSFLKHRLQTKLAILHLEMCQFRQGLELLPQLLSEVKKVDDKVLLVEIFLTEARLAFAVRNPTKAKAALTAAKTHSNAIHCPKHLQAMIDLVAGMVNMDEQDYRTAYSYFFESYEALHNIRSPRAVQALKYMSLCRIMSGATPKGGSDFIGKTSGTSMEYAEHPEIKCLTEIAEAYSAKALQRFEDLIQQHRAIIDADDLVKRHIKEASEQLLEQAILKAAAPYSEVEISHIAKKTNLSESLVAQKLAEMVLDRKTSGTIDQRNGIFILFDAVAPKSIYTDSVDAFDTLREVVQFLSLKVRQML